MKNLSKLSLLIIFLSIFISTPVLAIERTVPNEVVEGLDIGVFNTKIISQVGNKFNISFDVVNRDTPQAGLKYTLKLIKETKEGQFLADSYISEDLFSVGTNSTVSKEVDYTAPNISGKYKIFIFLSNISGYNFGLGFAGEVDLSSSSKNLEIIPDTCVLTIASDKVVKDEKKFNLTEGVDIAMTEDLKLSCEVQNSSEDSLDANPVYETHLRTLAGDIVSQNGGDTNSINFKAGEKKVISLILPKATKPQAYDVKVTLKNGANLSNSIVVHYVIQGSSATILKASLDKDYYQKGDIAKIALSWAPSADSFIDSRTGKGTENSNLTLVSNITSSTGKICLKSTESNLTQISISHKAEIPVSINSDCKNPKLSVLIKDANGNVLDQKEFTFDSTDIPTSNNKVIIFIILGILILCGAAFFIINLKKKTNETNI